MHIHDLYRKKGNLKYRDLMWHAHKVENGEYNFFDTVQVFCFLIWMLERAWFSLDMDESTL